MKGISLKLFEPLTIRDLTVPNRAWVSPMCQYACDKQDGVPTDWHLVHLGAFAQGGFGLIVTEAAAVAAEGRISPRDAGIWNDQQGAAWQRIVEFVHAQDTKIAIQLAHAGRKASTEPSLPGFDGGVVSADDGGWQPVGASGTPMDGLSTHPTKLDDEGIDHVIESFVDAAKRAIAVGFDALELHAAHGYLLSEFLSPYANTRDDHWGGNLEGRARVLTTIVDRIRAFYDGALFVRFNGSEWIDGGVTPDDAVTLAKILKAHDVDLADISSGGIAVVKFDTFPGYQVEFANRVRNEAEILTSTVGLIADPEHAEQILEEGMADVIMLGRVALREPHWPQRAAHELGIHRTKAPYRPSHWRGAWPTTEWHKQIPEPAR